MHILTSVLAIRVVSVLAAATSDRQAVGLMVGRALIAAGLGRVSVTGR